MANIKIVHEGEAEGLLRRIYDAAVKRAGRVFQILKVQSLNPPVLQSSMGLYRDTMFGESPLSRAQRELLAVVVSVMNECHY